MASHCFNGLSFKANKANKAKSIFPLFISSFICFYGPRLFTMVDRNSEELLKILKSAGAFMDDFIKKHPLKTKSKKSKKNKKNNNKKKPKNI